MKLMCDMLKISKNKVWWLLKEKKLTYRSQSKNNIDDLDRGITNYGIFLYIEGWAVKKNSRTGSNQTLRIPLQKKCYLYNLYVSSIFLSSIVVWMVV